MTLVLVQLRRLLKHTYIYIYVAFQCSPQEINALAMVTDKMLGKTWRKIMYQLNILWPTNEYMLECSNIEKKIGNIVWLKKKIWVEIKCAKKILFLLINIYYTKIMLSRRLCCIYCTFLFFLSWIFWHSEFHLTNKYKNKISVNQLIA